MKVQVEIEEWAIKEIKGVKKVTGTYKLMCGATKVAQQTFNDEYNSTTLIFPIELILEIEQLDIKIKEAITKNFTGDE